MAELTGIISIAGEAIPYSSAGVSSIGGKTGDITLGDGLTITGQELSSTCSTVSVSATGTSTDVVKYITIDGEEKKVGSDDAPVTSVNTKIGDVVLDASDVGALPDDTEYLVGATVLNKTLTLTKSDGSSVPFTDTGVQSVATGSANGTIAVDSTDVSVKGLDTAAYKTWTDTISSGSDSLITSGAVYASLAAVSSAMKFKGTLGVGGTITDLDTPTSEYEGYTYKVITAGTYASQAASVGDLFICGIINSTPQWVRVPAGESTDTVRALQINGTAWKDATVTSGPVNYVAGNEMTITGSGNNLTIASNVSYTLSGTTLTITF